MANTFNTQSLVEKQLAFSWMSHKGIGDMITWKKDAISAQKNTGATITLRRPSRIRATVTGLETAGAYDLPGVTQPLVGYSTLHDAPVPLTLAYRLEANMQTSMEEMTYKLDKEDVRNRFIDPAIVSIKDQYNQLLAEIANVGAGQAISISAQGGATYAQNFLKAAGKARALMIQRGAATDSSEKMLMANMDVGPEVGSSAATLYKYSPGVEGLQSGGIEIPKTAGFSLFESPLTYTDAIPADPGTIVVAAPGGAVTNGLTTYAPTMQLNTSGWGAIPTVKKGWRLALTGINWINPITQTTTGKQVVLVVVADAAVNAGAATITVAEAVIYSGDFRNTTLTTAIPNATALTLLGANSTVSPSLCFTKDSIVGVSPEIDLPSGLIYGKNFRVNGFNFAMIEDRWPGTMQNITKLVAFVGLAVVKPEGVVSLY